MLVSLPALLLLLLFLLLLLLLLQAGCRWCWLSWWSGPPSLPSGWAWGSPSPGPSSPPSGHQVTSLQLLFVRIENLTRNIQVRGARQDKVSKLETTERNPSEAHCAILFYWIRTEFVRIPYWIRTEFVRMAGELLSGAQNSRGESLLSHFIVNPVNMSLMLNSGPSLILPCLWFFNILL